MSDTLWYEHVHKTRLQERQERAVMDDGFAERLLRAVCEATRADAEAVKRRERDRSSVHARWLWAYLLRREGLLIEDICHFTNWRDRGSVTTAIQSVAAHVEAEPEFAKAVAVLSDAVRLAHIAERLSPRLAPRANGFWRKPERIEGETE